MEISQIMVPLFDPGSCLHTHPQGPQGARGLSAIPGLVVCATIFSAGYINCMKYIVFEVFLVLWGSRAQRE